MGTNPDTPLKTVMDVIYVYVLLCVCVCVQSVVVMAKPLHEAKLWLHAFGIVGE